MVRGQFSALKHGFAMVRAEITKTQQRIERKQQTQTDNEEDIAPLRRPPRLVRLLLKRGLIQSIDLQQGHVNR